jgi:hypothetical protein
LTSFGAAVASVASRTLPFAQFRGRGRDVSLPLAELRHPFRDAGDLRIQLRIAGHPRGQLASRIASSVVGALGFIELTQLEQRVADLRIGLRQRELRLIVAKAFPAQRNRRGSRLLGEGEGLARLSHPQVYLRDKALVRDEL